MRVITVDGTEAAIDAPGGPNPRAQRDEGLLEPTPRPPPRPSTPTVGSRPATSGPRTPTATTIVDRTKDMIIRGGLNIYPREVEEVLYEHPAVAAAAVIGIPHETLGEEVGAAVQLKPGAQATEDELRTYTKDRVAAYSTPHLVPRRAAHRAHRQDPKSATSTAPAL